MNSKGYPDMTALQLVNEIYKLSQTQNINFYYIGDYDVYGIDIMLNYAIGTWLNIQVMNLVKEFGPNLTGSVSLMNWWTSKTFISLVSN